MDELQCCYYIVEHCMVHVRHNVMSSNGTHTTKESTKNGLLNLKKYGPSKIHSKKDYGYIHVWRYISYI